MKTKEGVSPLIATVLVIGFTIVLSALVVQWGGGLFKGVQERTGATAELSEECTSLATNLEIEEVRYNEETKKVELRIDNKNNQDIEKITFRIHSPSKETTVITEEKITVRGDTEKNLPSGAVKTFELNVEGLSLEKLGIFLNTNIESTKKTEQCPKEELRIIKNVPEGLIEEEQEETSPECTISTDCPEGKICAGGICVITSPVCRVNTDCQQGKICIQGKCEETLQCISDTNCAKTEKCIQGKCILQQGQTLQEKCSEIQNMINSNVDRGVYPKLYTKSDVILFLITRVRLPTIETDLMVEKVEIEDHLGLRQLAKITVTEAPDTWMSGKPFKEATSASIVYTLNQNVRGQRCKRKLIIPC